MDAVSTNIYLGIALFISSFGYVFFGWLSDKIGRKPIVLTGCFLAALTYYPLFMGITHFANPDLEYAMLNNPAVVIADPSDCSVQFVPEDVKGFLNFTSSCDLLKNLLHSYSVSYSNEAASRWTLASVKLGNTTIHSVNIKNLTVIFV